MEAASIMESDKQEHHKKELGAKYILQMMLSAASAVRKRQDDVRSKLEKRSDGVASILKSHHSTASRLGAFMDRALAAAQDELEEVQADERERGEEAGIHPREEGDNVLKRLTQLKPGARMGVNTLLIEGELVGDNEAV